MKNLKVVKLKNGATLLYIKKENDPFASMTYGFRVGSNDETDDTRGIAHFIEHMCFSGTKKYTTDEINDLALLYGGDINASTSKTSTQFTLPRAYVMPPLLNEVKVVGCK